MLLTKAIQTMRNYIFVHCKTGDERHEYRSTQMNLPEPTSGPLLLIRFAHGLRRSRRRSSHSERVQTNMITTPLTIKSGKIHEQTATLKSSVIMQWFLSVRI